MNFQCIIFDCDGVLVDSEATSIAILLEIGATIGFQMEHQAAVEHFSGQSLFSSLEYMEQQVGRSFPSNIIEEFRNRTYEAFRRNIKAVPGVRAVLEDLALPRCVASNAPLEKIRLNLGLLDLLPFFGEALYSAYTVERWKPDPTLFLHAAQQMGYAPEACAIVEDSVSGVQAARAGGFTVFGYAPQPHRAALLKEAGAHTFTHMHELPQLWSNYETGI